MRAFCLFVSILCVVGCDGGEGDEDAGRDAGRADDAGRLADAGRDAGGAEDAGGLADAGRDAGGAEDAGPLDAGLDGGPVCGAGTLDQMQLDASFGFTDVAAGNLVAQTLTVGAAGRLSGIEVSLNRQASVVETDRVVLTVFDMAGVELGSASIPTSSVVEQAGAPHLSAASTGAGYFDLCDAAIDVAAGTMLRYVLTREGTTGVCTMVGPTGTCTGGTMIGSTCFSNATCNARVGHGQSTGDGYAGGAIQFPLGPGANDYAFKTFVY